MKKLFTSLMMMLFAVLAVNAEVTVSKTMTDIVSENSYTISAGNNVTCYTSFKLDNVVTVSTSGEANCGSFWGDTNTQWRLYQAKDGDVTVAVADGYQLKTVKFDYAVSNTGTLVDAASGADLSVSGSSVNYVVGNTGTATNGQVRITQITVTYEAAAAVELGDPVFSVDADPYDGMISKGDLEVQGLTMTFPEAENITPDMQIKVVATLQQFAGSMGFGAPTFANIEGLENVEFIGDAMFGDAVVNLAAFTEYILQNDPTAYMVIVSSIEVIGSTGVVASWTPNEEEGIVYGTAFQIAEDEASYEIFFDVEEGAEIDLAETKSINVNVGVPDLTGTTEDLFIKGMLFGKDGTQQSIFGSTDFEDGVNVDISRLTPGNSYQIVITKIGYGEEVGFDEEKFEPIYENMFEDEDGLAVLNFSIKAEETSALEANVEVSGTEMNVIFAVGTDLGDNYAVKPYILSESEKIEVAEYAIDNTTGGYFDPLNLIVITLNAELADGDYTLVLPAGMFIVNGGDNNTEWTYDFTVEDGVATSINGVAAENNNVMFNIAGQRVNNAKGIVIMNGKKMLKK